MTNSRDMIAMVVARPGPPDVLTRTRVPVPEPAAGQARMRVAYVGMNPVDAMVRRETLAWMPVSYPLILGLEHSGIVDSVGEGVDPALIGKAVLCRVGFGGYAEFSVSPAKSLVPLPDGIDLLTGCVYRGCSYTAWHALHACARLSAGDRVLIHSAAGAVGIMLMQIALDAGAQVCGLAGGAQKAAFAQNFSANVLDYLTPDWVDRARSAVPGGSFDIIIDGNGGAAAVTNYELIAPLGRIVYIGATAGSFAQVPDAATLIDKSFSVGGMTLREVESPPGSEADRLIVDRVRSGRWRVPISEVVDLENVADLHRRLEARKTMGRPVIRVGGDLLSERAEDTAAGTN